MLGTHPIEYTSYKWKNIRDIGFASIVACGLVTSIAYGLNHLKDKACHDFTASATGQALSNAYARLSVEDPAPVSVKVGNWHCQL